MPKILLYLYVTGKSSPNCDEPIASFTLPWISYFRPFVTLDLQMYIPQCPNLEWLWGSPVYPAATAWLNVSFHILLTIRNHKLTRARCLSLDIAEQASQMDWLRIIIIC